MIDETGKALGEISISEALSLAYQKGLDLVEVNPLVNPPVTRIMDFGKFIYKKTKAERKNRSSQKSGEIKGVRFGYATGIHDMEIKAKKIDAFLEKGYKVKIDMMVRGRERSHGDVVREKLNQFMKMISANYKVEQSPKTSPYGLSLLISKN